MLINLQRKKESPVNIPHKVILHSIGEYVFNHELNIWQHYIPFLQHLWYHHGICYHKVIDPSGLCVTMLSDNVMGGHAKGHNFNSVGIALAVLGAHTEATMREKIKDRYLHTKQKETLISILKSEYKGLPILTHDEVDNRFDAKGNKLKVDPGNIDLENIKKEIQ